MIMRYVTYGAFGAPDEPRILPVGPKCDVVHLRIPYGPKCSVATDLYKSVEIYVRERKVSWELTRLQKSCRLEQELQFLWIFFRILHVLDAQGSAGRR
jgi:hypothetical protein